MLRDKPRRIIPEAVDVAFHLDGRVRAQLVGGSQVYSTRRMHVEQCNHCNRRGDLELNVVPQPQNHRLKRIYGRVHGASALNFSLSDFVSLW